MARVTSEEVKEILETTETVFTTWINTANVQVNFLLSTPGLVTNSDLLEQIELYLAAHYFRIKELQEQRSKTGDSEGTFFGKAGMGLDFTPYGQQAIGLDPSGTLRDLGKPSASMETLEAIDHAVL